MFEVRNTQNPNNPRRCPRRQRLYDPKLTVYCQFSMFPKLVLHRRGPVTGRKGPPFFSGSAQLKDGGRSGGTDPRAVRRIYITLWISGRWYGDRRLTAERGATETERWPVLVAASHGERKEAGAGSCESQRQKGNGKVAAGSRHMRLY